MDRENIIKTGVSLRQAGLSYKDIHKHFRSKGIEIDFDLEGAIKTKISLLVFDTEDEMSELEIIRLDTMLKSIWPNVLKGDPKAIQQAIKIKDMRVELYKKIRNKRLVDGS